jgi:hypothetical protein
MDNGLDQLEDAATQVQVSQMPVDMATDEDLERLDILEKQKRKAEFYRQNPHLITDEDE